MKPINKIETGYLLNLRNANWLRRDLLNNVRTSLRALVRIGVLKHKERSYLEHELDKIVYKDKLKENDKNKNNK